MDNAQPQEKEASTIYTSMTEEEQPQLEAGLKSAEEQAEVEDNEAAPIEPEVEIPDDVMELLEDISTGAPTGENVENSEDKEALVTYMNLESEMDKRSGNDYEKCIKWSKTIVTEHSKHLRIAVWLCIAWFRTEGVSGFVNGLLLIIQLLKKYGEKLFPSGKKQQSRVLRSLNNDPRFALLKKVKFGDEKPVFSITAQKFNGAGVNELPRDVLLKMKKVKGQSFIGEENFLAGIKEELKKEKIDQNWDKLVTIFRDEDPESKLLKYGFSERSFKIMHSIEGFDEYTQKLLDLKDEEYTSPELLIDAASLAIGDEKAALYSSLLACLANRNITAFLDLERCLAQLIQVIDDYFGDEAPKLGNLTEVIAENVNRANNILDKDIEEAKARAQQSLMTKPAEPPEHKAEFAQKPEVESGPAPTAAPKAPSPSAIIEKIEKPLTPPPGDDQQLSVQKLTIKWETDAAIAIKKALRFHFVAENEHNEKITKVASDPRIYGISRILRWGNIKILPSDKTTPGPNEIKQQYLEQAFRKGEFDTVISDSEINFIGNDEFLFWLDAQRYVVQSLEQKGQVWADAAQEVKIHLARLITCLPKLPVLMFSDEKTPFANAETIKWLDDEIQGVFGEGRIKERILPPIMGEDYEPLKKEYEAACEELPKNFEQNAKALQETIAGDVRKKGQFLRRLNLANYCYLAKEYMLAKGFFDELVAQIKEYNIVEWEQALCVSVWQSVFLNNQKILKMELSPEYKTEIENKNKEFLKKIGRYDVVLAIKLTNNETGKESKQ